MSFRSRLLRQKIVQVSTAEYNDGWSVTPITFLLFEDRWGRRSYRVKAASRDLGAREYAYFDSPILAWMHGGEIPPSRLTDKRMAGRQPDAGGGNTRNWTDAMSLAERERLSKVLEMLGSEHEGEIVNAAKAASTFLKARNLTWAEALGVGPK
ncbi:MAG: hypothetical protein JWO51_2350 [Rhodospirillales bacterium]|nr:hypothetical protein [Rhodospirillales bacterium]